MPLTHAKPQSLTVEGTAAYLDVVRLPAERRILGGLLVIDSLGQPIEFVHSSVELPHGFMWAKDQAEMLAIASLSRALFDACRNTPSLIAVRDEFAPVQFCKTEIAPTIPFGQVSNVPTDDPKHWSWINSPPTAGMPALALFEDLKRRSLTMEPFERIARGLSEVYGTAMTEE